MSDRRPSQDPRYARLRDRDERRVRAVLDLRQKHLGDYRRAEP